MRGWKVALLNNLRPSQIPPGLPDDCFEEFDSCDTLASIRSALLEVVAEVVPVSADPSLPQRLSEGGFHFVFNIAEGTGRRCREAVPAAVCELLRIPFSASDPLTLGLTLDKALARRVVGSEIRVPDAVLVQRESDFDALDRLRYPVIVKPNDEGSSKGIRDNPIADAPASARSRCEHLLRRYGCPPLVEEYIEGIEVTVGILGNTPRERVLGVMEIAPVHPDPHFVYSLEVKRDWRRCVSYHVPPRLEAGMVAMIEATAIRAFRLLGCRDFARIDFRLDRSGTLFFLECNALPGLDPANSDLVFLSGHILTYRQLVQAILLEAALREAAPAP
jgi:D-alanine-D-alanine ligase